MKLIRIVQVREALMTRRLLCAWSPQVCFHNEKTEFVVQHNVRVPRDGCVKDVLDKLSEMLGPQKTGGQPLRMLEIYNSKLYKVRGLRSAHARSLQIFLPAFELLNHACAVGDSWESIKFQSRRAPRPTLTPPAHSPALPCFASSSITTPGALLVLLTPARMQHPCAAQPASLPRPEAPTLCRP